MNYFKVGLVTGGIIVITAISFNLGQQKEHERKPEKELHGQPVSQQEAQDRLVAWRNKAGPAEKPAVVGYNSIEEMPEELRADAQKALQEAHDQDEVAAAIDPVRFKTDPEYQKDRYLWLKVRSYNKSPAKDTPECQAIVDLLKENGLGLDAVMGAYNVAWEARHVEELLSTHDENERAQLEPGLRRAYVDLALYEWRKRYPQVTDAMVEDILQLRPTVFWGNDKEFMFEVQPPPGTVTVGRLPDNPAKMGTHK